MPDVNVLVYAHRRDHDRHDAYRSWLENLASSNASFALSTLVAVGFLRIVTNPRIFDDPTPLPQALAVVESIAARSRCRVISPAEGHLEEVARLCRLSGAIGSDVADAQHAAVAIASAATWVTRDGAFARFAPHGLSWQHLDL